VKCRCGPALHLSSSLSFRFEATGRSAVVSGDTGPCPGLEEFARGADLLLLETSLRTRDHDETRHLTPEEAGTLARRAGAARLVLHHLTASSESSAALAAGAFGGPTLVAADGLRLRV
jgi:ribonuclease BN (tRNA processing enzyme)